MRRPTVSTARRAVPLTVVAILALLVAPGALAASSSAVAAVTPASPGAGTTGAYTYTLTPNSGQIGSFNLTAPGGWSILSVDSAPAGVQLATGSTTVIQGRGLTVTASSPLSVSFTAQAPCSAGASAAWTTAARAGSNFTGNSIPVNDVPASLTGSCTAAFVSGREPADAAFNGGTTSQNVTSVPYTPAGAPIQAIVKDASGAARSGISITLRLTTNPTGATLSGSITETSDANGLVTFSGTPSPISVSKIGQGYKMTPTNDAAAVAGTEQAAAFGIYQEGEPCATACVVHGHNGNGSVTTTVTAPPGGTLGTFVSSFVDVTCTGYTPLTADSIVWKYTGSGSQTIDVFLTKSVVRTILDRGSDHLEFCFDSEGKPFTDKFGVAHWGTSGNDTPGLLPDCNATLDGKNCIVAETGLSGGGRQVTVTVEDGKGRI